jgi:malonyl-ACP decarboxylase
VAVLSELLSIRGEGFVVAGASASGNVAILKASQLIQLGIVDVCVIVGALSDLSPLALQGFYNTGAMGGKRFKSLPNKACRPFDKSHEGFIYGQGCGCVILEAAESVKKRGIKPFAKLLGGALLLDGHSLPDPSEVGEIKVMTHCLELACIKPHEVDYINAHGSSSPLGDITEINAIKQVFSHEINKIWINSTKGLIGHCLFAAGVIEAIACVVQMQNNFIHPNINLVNAIDNICLFAPKQAMSSNIYIAMNNSFGFGGINSSLLLKKVD